MTIPYISITNDTSCNLLNDTSPKNSLIHYIFPFTVTHYKSTISTKRKHRRNKCDNRNFKALLGVVKSTTWNFYTSKCILNSK